MITTDLVAVP